MNNNFENNMNETQFEDMRQQLNTLKKKLDAQEIVNDRLVRRSMRNEVNNITRRYYIIMAVSLLMIPYGYWCFVVLSHLSLAFWIGTSIFMLICGGATFYNCQKISDNDMMGRSLLEARKKVASAKKFEADWLKFGIPAVILWLSWFFYELYQNNSDATMEAFFWGGCIGAIIGAICGIKIHLKTQRQYQDIIDQIEDLTADQ
jgi:hypothetical protein